MSKTERNGPGVRPRHYYDESYKRHAVALTLQEGRTVKEVAAELGIGAWALYDWRRLYAPAVGVAAPAPRTLSEAEAEIERLRAENARLRERELILKKSLGILSETPRSGMPESPR